MAMRAQGFDQLTTLELHALSYQGLSTTHHPVQPFPAVHRNSHRQATYILPPILQQ